MSSIANIPENRTLRGAVIDYTSDRTLPLNECKVYFSPVQAGEGTPSPENVREISGWDHITIVGLNRRLPMEYQEVEYLEGTGTQYIDVDATLKEYEIDCTTAITGTRTNNGFVTGSSLWNDSAGTAIMISGVAYSCRRIYNNTAYSTIVSATDNINKKLRFIIKKDYVRIINVDTNEVLAENINEVEHLYESPVFLFHAYSNGAYLSRYVSARIYHCAYTYNEELAYDLIPCYRISDHTPGMFDLVSNQFYTNSGTGNFILGPEVGITIDFPKTIYGGYVDLIRGEIVEDIGKFAPTNSYSVHFVNGNGNIYIQDTYFNQNGFVKPINVNKSLSTHLYPVLTTTGLDGVFAVSDAGIFATRTSAFTTTSEFNTWVANQIENGTPLEFYMELVTPNTYPISPIDLRLLRGTNKFSSNLNGDIEISFAAEEYPQLSGNIVTFNSPVEGKQFEECKVYFTPKQDLHGYSKPWVGGSGKNKLNESLFGDSTSRTTLAVQLNPNTTYTLSTNIPQQLITILTQNTNLESSGNPYNGHPCTFITTENGEITLSYYNGSSVAIKDYQVQIEVGSTATSYEPYENICPIEGWDGIEINITGKNLIQLPTTYYRYYPNGSTFSASGASYSTFIFPVPKGTIYYDSPSNGRCSYCGLCDEIPTSGIKCYENLTMTNRSKSTFDNSAGHKYMFITGSRSWESNSEVVQNSGIVISVAQRGTDNRTPYSTTINIPFNRTIYGGYVDLVTKEVIETETVREIYASESVSASKRTSNTIAAPYNITNAANKNALKYSHGGIRSRNTASLNYMSTNQCCLLPYNTNPTYVLIGASPSVTKASEYQGWIESLAQPLQVLYELNIPQSYSLDIDTLTTLKNTNTLFSNANDNISVRAIGNIPAPLHPADFIRRENAAAPHIESQTGNYLTFRTDMEMPLTSSRIYFTPKQDLHGYSKPWVGGAGKNLLNKDNYGYIDNTVIVFGGDNTSIPDGSIALKAGTYTFSVNETMDTIAISDQNASNILLTTNTNSTTFTINEDKTVRIIIGKNGGNFLNYNYQLEKGSTATAYEPYENICPIEGWDGITVNRCGKNLYPYSQGSIGAYQPTFLKANNEYVFSADTPNGGNPYVRVRYVDGTVSPMIWLTKVINGKHYATFTPALDTNGAFMFLAVGLSSPMIELGSELTDYEPYNDTTTTITFPKTIYGGYVDLVSGEVVETWVNHSYTQSNQLTKKSSGGDYLAGNSYRVLQNQTNEIYYAKTPTSGDIYGFFNIGEWTSYNMRPFRAYVDNVNGLIKITISQTNRFFSEFDLTNSSDVDAMIQKVCNTYGEFKIVVKLAESGYHTYPIAFIPITTLSGINNLWTTANGDTQISYYRHSDDSYQYINAQAIASNNNYLLVTDDGFVIGNEENVTVY